MNEKFIPQSAFDCWYENKITQLIDFYWLKNLRFYSYEARVILIIKQWIYKQKPSVKLNNIQTLKKIEFKAIIN